jgi:hypothetical protein
MTTIAYILANLPKYPPLYICRESSTNKLFYAKQTQFPKSQNEYKSCYDKALRQFISSRTPPKQTQFKPNQTQFLPQSRPQLPMNFNLLQLKTRYFYSAVRTAGIAEKCGFQRRQWSKYVKCSVQLPFAGANTSILVTLTEEFTKRGFR